jgi:hypothetical protein
VRGPEALGQGYKGGVGPVGDHRQGLARLMAWAGQRASPSGSTSWSATKDSAGTRLSSPNLLGIDVRAERATPHQSSHVFGKMNAFITFRA